MLQMFFNSLPAIHVVLPAIHAALQTALQLGIN